MRVPSTVVAVAVLGLCTTRPVAQEFFRLEDQQIRATDLLTGGCYPDSITVPPRADPWNVRAAVVFTPPEAALAMSFHDVTGKMYGRAQHSGGYLEVDGRLPGATSPRLVGVCVGRGDDSNAAIKYTVHASWTGNSPWALSAPTGSEWAEYDDELYRHLIFDDNDSPGQLAARASSVLHNPIPQFYIRLGGPEGCNPTTGWRVTLEMLHHWRAIVPVIAEQLTGVPYPHRVEAGCDPRPDQYGWVMVHYVTVDEYEKETGSDWGQAAARARVGAFYGRIWMNIGMKNWGRSTMAHEVGHAFGLSHTNRRGALMGNSGRDVHVFTAEEEAAARRAYRAGRGARYCGDPDECGNGQPPGFRFFDLPERPVVVVVD